MENICGVGVSPAQAAEMAAPQNATGSKKPCATKMAADFFVADPGLRSLDYHPQEGGAREQ
jgi:hypothetical protein